MWYVLVFYASLFPGERPRRHRQDLYWAGGGHLQDLQGEGVKPLFNYILSKMSRLLGWFSPSVIMSLRLSVCLSACLSDPHRPFLSSFFLVVIISSLYQGYYLHALRGWVVSRMRVLSEKSSPTNFKVDLEDGAVEGLVDSDGMVRDQYSLVYYSSGEVWFLWSLVCRK